MLFYNEFINDYNNGFWEVDEDDLIGAEFGDEIRLYNAYGGFHYHRLSREDKFISASSWNDLPWEEVYLKPNSKLGWLSPSGEFFGCDYRDHDNLATYVLGFSERELESKGWVKIYSVCGEVLWFHNDLNPTVEQIRELRERGFELDEEVFG